MSSWTDQRNNFSLIIKAISFKCEITKLGLLKWLWELSLGINKIARRKYVALND